MHTSGITEGRSLWLGTEERRRERYKSQEESAKTTTSTLG